MAYVELGAAPLPSPAEMTALVARALERGHDTPPPCPQCGTQFGGGRWRRDGDRHHCTSCTGTSGRAFVDERAPTAAERLAVPGVRAVLTGARGRLWLDVDADAFIATTGLVLAAADLAAAATSTDPHVRLRVAKHHAVTAALLDGLATDVEERVRLAVATHLRTSHAALTLLAQDPNDEVRARTERRTRPRHVDPVGAEMPTKADGSPDLEAWHRAMDDAHRH